MDTKLLKEIMQDMARKMVNGGVPREIEDMAEEAREQRESDERDARSDYDKIEW